MGWFDFIVTLVSMLSSGTYEGYGMLIGKIACLRSVGAGGRHVVGRIKNTAENITSVVAKVLGEYLPRCYGFELGLHGLTWCRGCMYLSSYGTTNLSCQFALILSKISCCQIYIVSVDFWFFASRREEKCLKMMCSHLYAINLRSRKECT